MAFHRLPDGEFTSTDGSECARLDRSPGTSSLATRWRKTGHCRRCRYFHAPEPWRFCPILENIADRFGPNRARWMGIRSDARGQTLLGSWQTPGAHYLASTSPRLGRPGSAGTLDRSASISPLHFTGEHRFRRAGRGAVPNESRKIKMAGTSGMPAQPKQPNEFLRRGWRTETQTNYVNSTLHLLEMFNILLNHSERTA